MGIGVTLEGMAEVKTVLAKASEYLNAGWYDWASDQVARCLEIGVNALDKELNG